MFVLIDYEMDIIFHLVVAHWPALWHFLKKGHLCLHDVCAVTRAESTRVYGKCSIYVIKIPKSTFFIDYLVINITNSGCIVISSQENSSVWLGTVNSILKMEDGES